MVPHKKRETLQRTRTQQTTLRRNGRTSRRKLRRSLRIRTTTRTLRRHHRIRLQKPLPQHYHSTQHLRQHRNNKRRRRTDTGNTRREKKHALLLHKKIRRIHTRHTQRHRRKKSTHKKNDETTSNKRSHHERTTIRTKNISKQLLRLLRILRSTMVQQQRSSKHNCMGTLLHPSNYQTIRKRRIHQTLWGHGFTLPDTRQEKKERCYETHGKHQQRTT